MAFKDRSPVPQRVLLKMAAHMSQARRERLPSSQFAIPAKKAKKIGVEHEIKGEAKGKYPIPDLAHARNALARVSQHGTPEEREAVRKKVYAKYPQLREHFKESHGGESPTASDNVRKVEQGDIGKTGCFKTATINALFDELSKIAGLASTAARSASKVLGAVKPPPLPKMLGPKGIASRGLRPASPGVEIPNVLASTNMSQWINNPAVQQAVAGPSMRSLMAAYPRAAAILQGL